MVVKWSMPMGVLLGGFVAIQGKMLFEVITVAGACIIAGMTLSYINSRSNNPG